MCIVQSGDCFVQSALHCIAQFLACTGHNPSVFCPWTSSTPLWTNTTPSADSTSLVLLVHPLPRGAQYGGGVYHRIVHPPTIVHPGLLWGEGVIIGTIRYYTAHLETDTCGHCASSFDFDWAQTCSHVGRRLTFCTLKGSLHTNPCTRSSRGRAQPVPVGPPVPEQPLLSLVFSGQSATLVAIKEYRKVVARRGRPAYAAA